MFIVYDHIDYIQRMKQAPEDTDAAAHNQVDRDKTLHRAVSQVYCSCNAHSKHSNKLCGKPPHYAPALCKLTFNRLTLKVVSESRVTWATSVPILVSLCLSVLDLGPMYATDRQTSDAHHRLMLPTLGAGA